MSNVTINNLPAAVTIDAIQDYLPIYTASSVATQKINRNTFLGITGSPVGNSDSQTLTNKTIGNTNTLTAKDTLFTLQDDGDTTKQARFQLSGITTATTRTYTLPDVNDTLVTLTATQTLTNKTLTSPTINTANIQNPTLAVDTITGFSTATLGTAYGLSISNGVLNSNNSVVTANITDAAVTPAKLIAGTGAVWTTTTYTPTVTGWAATPTTSARYIQMGKIVYLIFSISGTSNATTATMTLPVASRSTGSFVYDGMNGYAQNNATEVTTGTRWYIDPGSNASLVNFYKDTAFAAWTNSGTKLIRGYITYEAA